MQRPTHDGSDWSYRMVIEDRECLRNAATSPLLPAFSRAAHNLPTTSPASCPAQHPPAPQPELRRAPSAGYKRMAVMRRTIRISAIVQLVYICIRTLWHSIPFLTGGALLEQFLWCLGAERGCPCSECCPLAAQ